MHCYAPYVYKNGKRFHLHLVSDITFGETSTRSLDGEVTFDWQS
jgi:hypothetical protein